MKRNINLQELSRDHHHGLLLGWKIRQGLKYMTKPEVIAEYVAYFFKEALVPHFKEEETHVLRYLSDEDPYKQRTLKEHKDISALISQLSLRPVDDAALLNLGEQMDSHIRFEERELFPYLQEALDDESLEKIGAAIASDHKPFVEDFPLEFWNGPTD